MDFRLLPLRRLGPIDSPVPIAAWVLSQATGPTTVASSLHIGRCSVHASLSPTVPCAIWDVQRACVDTYRWLSTRQETAARQRQSRGGSRQDCWADDRAWNVSWMSLSRIDQNPGRGSGRSCRDR